ncbi:hypothetical protein BCR33DRAFT_847267 [Rhizoclosmatium globosum]|uniref:VASt domain-containing protein n=1 Tax=Rhizoclosmatium globosum TaxID=329046 RepID=A0A1Y2CSJ5_9FUNG|nr:hypothetical protein BCR33DRAFT_847267 [Rhizoclosmatium globosum]|eukprot:ORY50040.1 hypothetical protein BCR33DRAFT_847267 [Rhizoclosmatium globosum]
MRGSLGHKDEEFTLNVPAKRAFDIMFGSSPETKAMYAKFFASRVMVKEAGVESIAYLIRKWSTSKFTPALPYSDSFVPIVKYCITWTGKNSCKVMMFTGVKFIKSPMVKSIIRQQAMTGSEQFAKDLATAGAGAPAEAVVARFLQRSINYTFFRSGNKAESILPFGLSQSYMWQWGMVGLLGLSLLLNLLSLFRGGSKATQAHLPA